MAETITEPVAPPASLSEFRQRKAAAAAPTPPVDKQASAVENSETAGTSASPTQETQDKPKKRAQNAEERAAELRAAGRVKEAEKIESDAREHKEFEDWKASKDQRERERLELEELRRGTRKPPEPTPISQPTPQAAPSSVADPTRPKLKDFLAKPENKDKPYDEVVEQWKDADDDWKDNRRKAQDETNRRVSTYNERLAKAKEKYPDFDNAVSIPIATPANLAVLVQEFENGLEVVYNLYQNPIERQRILNLPPARQLAELGMLAVKLSQPAAPSPQVVPERPPSPPPVSRTPPPIRTLGGLGSSDEDPKGPPKSFSEHRARRQKAS